MGEVVYIEDYKRRKVRKMQEKRVRALRSLGFVDDFNPFENEVESPVYPPTK